MTASVHRTDIEFSICCHARCTICAWTLTRLLLI